MTPKTFDVALGRLECQWPRSYSAERRELIHGAFKDVSDGVFMDAVTDCLLNCRATPLMPELERAVERARTREKEVRFQRGYGGSFASVLQDAAGANKGVDPEFVKACIDAVVWKIKTNTHHESKEWQDILTYIDRMAKGFRARKLDSGV